MFELLSIHFQLHSNYRRNHCIVTDLHAHCPPKWAYPGPTFILPVEAEDPCHSFQISPVHCAILARIFAKDLKRPQKMRLLCGCQDFQTTIDVLWDWPTTFSRVVHLSCKGFVLRCTSRSDSCSGSWCNLAANHSTFFFYSFFLRLGIFHPYRSRNRRDIDSFKAGRQAWNRFLVSIEAEEKRNNIFGKHSNNVEHFRPGIVLFVILVAKVCLRFSGDDKY